MEKYYGNPRQKAELAWYLKSGTPLRRFETWELSRLFGVSKQTIRNYLRDYEQKHQKSNSAIRSYTRHGVVNPDDVVSNNGTNKRNLWTNEEPIIY